MAVVKRVEEINAIVKKHKAIINCENSLPLASRKIFNILLFLVKDRFGKDLEHQVSENDVISLLNKTDRDITNARINYKKLASTVIEYNILNQERDHLNGVGTMLAPAVINKTKKTWNFSFPPNIVQWVQDPSSFVFLDITTQERFSSKYSQALWEICIGSLEDQFESYFSVTLEECRVLMCGKDNHQIYKDFKRRVVMTAINEINEKSLLHVELYKENKEGRKVTELVFFVTKEEYIEPAQLIADDTFSKMVEVFGITENMARKIMDRFDEGQILRNLDYTEQQFRKAVKNKNEHHFNLGAYATSAITKDYAPKPPQLLTKVIEEKRSRQTSEQNAVTAKSEYSEDLIKRISAIYQQIDRPLQEGLKSEFEKSGMRGPVKKLFNDFGWGSDKVKNHFFIFLSSQIEQGRKGLGYDQIIGVLNDNVTH